jgi:hypothetical protein
MAPAWQGAATTVEFF